MLSIGVRRAWGREGGGDPAVKKLHSKSGYLPYSLITGEGGREGGGGKG